MHIKPTEEFLHLCRCLSVAPEPAAAPLTDILSRSPDLCARIVYWATEHFVTPYLYERLLAKDLLSVLPPDLAEFLATFRGLNAERNSNLKAQLIELASAVGDDMSLVVLKGGANLVEANGAAIGRWMMNDLDVLVAAQRFDEARRAVERLGYRPIDGVGGAHAIAYAHSTWPGPLEIHFDVGPQRDILPADAAVARAEPVAGMPIAIRVLAPTDRVLHNIWHAQIQDRRHELAIMSLQQLVNLATVIEGVGPRVDWSLVERQFRRYGHRAALGAYLHAARQLMGIAVPLDLSANLRSRIHLRRALLELDSRLLQTLVTYWAVMTPLLSRDRLRYTFGCDVSGLRLLTARAVIVSGYVRRHRLRIFAKVAEVRRERYWLR